MSTYERGGIWYTMQVVDASSKVERLATADEIEAANPADKAAPKATKPKAKKHGSDA